MLKWRQLFFGIFLPVSIGYAAVAPGSLDHTLQYSIQNYLDQNSKSLGISAVQLSVLMPGDNAPRDFVAGSQYLGQPVPVATTSMLMQWGSVTKEYTSALIFQLINAGKLSQNDTLLQLFPEQFTQGTSTRWPDLWKNVTLTQLMNMTSGIPSYTNANLSPKQYSLSDLVGIAAQYQFQNGCSMTMGCFPAGAAYYYSNTNYILLGMVVEKLRGMSFASAINQYILVPLQNQGDQVYYYGSIYPANILAKMVNGYNYYAFTRRLQIPMNVTSLNMSWAASAGALLGNMDGLVKMTQTLYTTNDIVPAGELMQNAVQIANGQAVTNPSLQCTGAAAACYAMGIALFYDADQGGTIWWYQGETLGYNAVYMWFPSEKVIVAVAQNAAPSTPSLVNLALQINAIIRQYLVSDATF